MIHPREHLNFENLILYEDQQVICINKPAGISSLDLRNQPGTGLLHLARQYWADIRICHRLDQYTTGLLLFAKDAETYRSIAMQLENREAEKHYNALIPGSHRMIDRIIEEPLSPSIKGKVHIDYQLGKPSTSIVNTETQFRHFTFVDVQPITGRSHQIRVHLASISCPVVGDTLYGGTQLMLSEFKHRYKYNAHDEERPLNRGYLLHSRSFKFVHPGTQVLTEFFAPFQKNMEVCLKQLEKYDSL